MKATGIVLATFLLISCSDADVEEFTFRKTIEYELTELCGDDDAKCVSAVKAQTKDCMEKSDWRRYLKNQEDQQELKRFTSEFYACIVDEEGNPYFHSNV